MAESLPKAASPSSSLILPSTSQTWMRCARGISLEKG